MRDRWEFPGGKVVAGETAEAALKRELYEELGIEVLAADRFRSLEHDYPDLRVAIDFFIVSAWRGQPGGCEGQNIKWVCRRRLGEQNLLPADAPVVQALSRIP